MKSLNKHLALFAVICAVGMLIGSSVSYGAVNSLKSKDWQGLVDDFTKRIETQPNDATLYHDRAIAYAALGKLKRAIEDGTKAIQLNPKYTNAYINRGIDYIALGDHNRAMADFNKAIELEPKDASAHYARGFVYYKLGRVKEAEEDFAKSAQLGYKGAQDLTKSKENAVEEKAGLKTSAPKEVGRRPDTGPTPPSP
jgi:tetratricopeptide (TPR) repeat protein